jgi:hypothetical protein
MEHQFLMLRLPVENSAGLVIVRHFFLDPGNRIIKHRADYKLVYHPTSFPATAVR